MNNTSDSHGILFEDGQFGPFPMHRLKRVDKPTNLVTDNVQRVDFRENAFARGERGDYGPAVQRASLRPMMQRHPLSAAEFDVLHNFSSTKNNEAVADKAPITEDPEVLSRHIKCRGYFLKADIMGICRLPKSAVFSHDHQGNPPDVDYPYAIVIVTRKEFRTVDASNGYDWIGDPISFQAYQRCALVAQTMANYIRRLGYRASPQTASGYDVLIPPLLLWAGIGEVSRVGIVLNPFLGLSFKAAAVLTDLPLEADKPIDFGLQDFCQHCKICAEICPSKAILTGDKVMYNGYETWKLNEQRCASFSLLNKHGTICNLCVKVCPWSNPTTWPHNLVRWTVEHSGLARRLAIKSSRVLGVRKANEKERWWFDLEYDIDELLRIPPHNKD